MGAAPPEPPSRRRENRQSGDRPRPQAYQFADPPADRILLRKAEHVRRPVLPIPIEIAQLVEESTVRWKRRREEKAVHVADEGSPGEADHEARKVADEEQREVASSLG